MSQERYSDEYVIVYTNGRTVQGHRVILSTSKVDILIRAKVQGEFSTYRMLYLTAGTITKSSSASIYLCERILLFEGIPMHIYTLKMSKRDCDREKVKLTLDKADKDIPGQVAKEAVEKGIVVGGGCTLLSLAAKVDAIKDSLEIFVSLLDKTRMHK
ncbi:hypothetical protein AgCh_017753 [Apium graveolens]